MRIGNQIRQLCRLAGISPENTDEMVGLPEGYINGLENGSIILSCDALGRLAEALSIPFARLFSEDISWATTSQLTPRVTLMELACEDPGQRLTRPMLLPSVRWLVG